MPFPPTCLDRMACFPRCVDALLVGLSADDLRWRPPSGAWSILEVLCHLADEEVLDFRARVQRTLAEEDWEPIDPEGWAVERRYNEQSPVEVMARFEVEREKSVAWLKSLREPDWDGVHEHPRFGGIAAGDVMASWLAHDALHLRQIAKRLYELAARDGEPFGTGYAGKW